MKMRVPFRLGPNTRSLLLASLCILTLGLTASCSDDSEGNTNQNNATVRCGNGAMDPGEECDGAALGGQTCEGLGYGRGVLACRSDCHFDETLCEGAQRCGNGQLESPEECDDGNELDCDGCSSACVVEACGNGQTECDESCDDGNQTGGDGCSADCTSDESCGNGVVDVAAGEQCEDGNLAEWDGCTNGCRCAELQVNTTWTGAQTGPEVDVSGDGGFVVTWRSDGQDGSGDGVFGQLYDASDIVSVAELQINTHWQNEQGWIGLSRAPDGRFVVVWRSDGQDGDGYGVFGQRFDAAGQPVGTEFQINVVGVDNQDRPAVAMADDGSFVVAYSSRLLDGNGQGIFRRQYDNTGAATGGELQVNTYWTNNQGTPDIAMAGDGRHVIVWQSIAQDGDGVGVYGQRFAATGAAEGAEFPIHNVVAGTQQKPHTAMADDGSFVVIWGTDGQSGGALWDLYGRRFNSGGVALGAEFQVNTASGASYATGGPYASIGMAGDGRFVVAWPGDGTGGNGLGVYARRYDANGVAQGAEFLVHTYTSGDQLRPSVAVHDTGEFLIAWDSDAQDGDLAGVYIRAFDAAGTPLCLGAP